MDERQVDSEANFHSLARRAAAAIRRDGLLANRSRIELCRALIENRNLTGTLADFAVRLGRLDRVQRHYLIGALYMLLLPERRRERLAAYFTPPSICSYVMRRVTELGFNSRAHTAIDPACGGAAFLVPLAEAMAAAGPKEAAPLALGRRLAGVEIEPGLAMLSELLILDVLREHGVAASALPIIRRSSTLKDDLDRRVFDLVVGNPPYGRVFRPSSHLLSRWGHVLSDSHTNTYALFVARALELAKPGGLIALVLPTSFISGPYFSALRAHIRMSADVLRIDLVEPRAEAFLDVVQDTCILVLRKNMALPARLASTAPKCAVLDHSGVVRDLGNVVFSSDAYGLWAMPSIAGDSDASIFDPRLSNLAEYGYEVRVGYFVWNRSKKRIRQGWKARKNEVPLIWAENVRPNSYIKLAGRARDAARDKISFARMPPNSPATLRGAALVIQRTTNRGQSRRIVAGLVPTTVSRTHGGFVTENHTLVVRAKKGAEQKLQIKQLMRLLNSRAVDGLFRRMSGTASVSAKLLRQLPLPAVQCLSDQGALTDEAIRQAYAKTLIAQPITSQPADVPDRTEN